MKQQNLVQNKTGLWLPGTGVLTPRGTGEVGTKGVEQHRHRLSQPLMYKEGRVASGDSVAG